MTSSPPWVLMNSRCLCLVPASRAEALADGRALHAGNRSGFVYLCEQSALLARCPCPASLLKNLLRKFVYYQNEIFGLYQFLFSGYGVGLVS